MLRILKRRALVGFLLLVLVLIVLFVAVNIANAPGISSMSSACSRAAEDCKRFPTISGSNLQGTTVTLPDDFEGKITLVIVPFDQDQQVKAAAWLPLATELAQTYPDFAYVSAAVFPDMAPAMRLIIRAGMSAAGGAAEVQAISLTVFLEDRQAFLDALAITDMDEGRVFLLDAKGEAIWRASGDYTAEKGEALKREVATAAARR